MLQRFLRLFKLGLPSYFWPKMAGLFGLIVLQTYVEDYNSEYNQSVVVCEF